MRTLVAEVSPGVFRRIPGFYAHRDKYYLVDDEITEATGGPVRLDLVINVLCERYGLDKFRFERVRTR